jgi:hypothetical protein
MPALDDPRRERFAQLVAAGWTRTGAYQAAGFNAGRRSARNSASLLARRDGVRQRVKEIMAEPGWRAGSAPLEDPRWERFVQRVAAGSSLTDAYIGVGFNARRKTAGTHASRLGRRERVRNRAQALLTERLRTLHGEEAASTAPAPLKEARRERFAQSVVAGSSLTDAYLEAGYRSGRENAWGDAARLAKRTCVGERVSALREQQLSMLRATSAKIEAAAGIDFDWLRTKGVRLLDETIGQDNVAASRTLERIARICGYWMERAPPEEFEYKVGDVTVHVTGWRRR